MRLSVFFKMDKMTIGHPFAVCSCVRCLSVRFGPVDRMENVFEFEWIELHASVRSGPLIYAFGSMDCCHGFNVTRWPQLTMPLHLSHVSANSNKIDIEMPCCRIFHSLLLFQHNCLNLVSIISIKLCGIYSKNKSIHLETILQRHLLIRQFK